jgi:eukaryotic-like serine/threonine-protein kinase
LLEPGQIFAARYRVNRRIAEGGMGAIFEAEHTATERKVALKLLFPHIMSVASARKKFELEAKISARVNSQNIVEVLDAGFDEGTKSPFLVMELLEGQTLAHYIRERGPLGLDQALHVLAQVAAGLDAAHGYREASGTSKPIVHRDLKPENLFMANEHGAVVVKILDYGIAKVLGETGNVSQEVRGTPLYMAFEQVTAGALSPQTDVWALGLIAYFIFTGCHYWRSANQPSANVQSLFAEILTLPLEAPSARLRQQNGSVQLPVAFDAWLLECIQRDPTRRFHSAGAAVEALAKASGQGPRARPRADSRPAGPIPYSPTEAFQAPPPTPEPYLGTAASLPGITSERLPSAAPAPHPKRKPKLAVAAAAGGAVLLVGVGWLVFGSGDAPRPGAASPPSSASSAVSTSALANEPSPRSKATASHEPRVAPAEPAPANAPTEAPAPDPSALPAAIPVALEPAAPAPSPEPAPPAPPPAATEAPATSSPSAPQIRVAPRDEAEPEVGRVAEAPPRAERAPVAPTPTASPPTASALAAPATKPPAQATAPGVRAPSASTSATATPPARAPTPASKKNIDAYRMR